MGVLTPPSINGVRSDFSSIRARIGAFSLAELWRSLNYGDEVTPGIIEGGHPVPVDTTLGRYKATGSFEMLEEHFYQLIETLGDGYSALVFPITVTKLRPAGGPPNVDVLNGCRILKPDGTYSKDDQGGLLIKVDLFVRYITRNGKCLVPLVL